MLTLETDLFDAVFDSINQVRKLDIPVEKITLKREHYHNIMTTKQFMLWHINNPSLMSKGRPDRTIGELFGVPIIISDESRVYGKKGIRPRALLRPAPFEDDYMPSIVYEEQPGYSVEIKINNKLRRLKKNLTIIVKSRAYFFSNIPKNEWAAIDTLREMITELEFRKYMKYGFILVKGKSGKVYQIFRSGQHTKVWLNGKIVEEICVRIKDYKIPPTDHVVAFKTMIEADETYFHQVGNVYNMRKAA